MVSFHLWFGCACCDPVLGCGCWFLTNFPWVFQCISPFYAWERERSCCLSMWSCREPFAVCTRLQFLLLAMVWQMSPAAACAHMSKSKVGGDRFPAVLWDVPGYGALKPQAWVLRLGNTWLRYDGNNAGWRWGGSSSSLNLVPLCPQQHPVWDVPHLCLRGFFFSLFMPARCGQNISTILGASSEKDFWTWVWDFWLVGLPPIVGCRAGGHAALGELPHCCFLAWWFFLALIFHLHPQTGIFTSISLKHQLAWWYPAHFMTAGASGSLRSCLARGLSFFGLPLSLPRESLGCGFGTWLLLSLWMG